MKTIYTAMMDDLMKKGRFKHEFTDSFFTNSGIKELHAFLMKHWERLKEPPPKLMYVEATEEEYKKERRRTPTADAPRMAWIDPNFRSGYSKNIPNPKAWDKVDEKKCVKVRDDAFLFLRSIKDEGYDLTWQTARGTLPKRIASDLYKLGWKLSDAVTSELGTMCKKHVQDNMVAHLDVVNKFDWEPGNFGDKGSCFWGEKHPALRLMMNNGGYAVRLFKDEKGYARCWVMPIKGGLVCINAYGEELTTFGRLLSAILELSYKKLTTVTNEGVNSGMMWINGGSGIMVAQPASLAKTNAIDLGIKTKKAITCEECGVGMEEVDSYAWDDRLYCHGCMEHCPFCEESYRGKTYLVVDIDALEYHVCRSCYDEVVFCTRCKDKKTVASEQGLCPAHLIEKRRLDEKEKEEVPAAAATKPWGKRTRKGPAFDLPW